MEECQEKTLCAADLAFLLFSLLIKSSIDPARHKRSTVMSSGDNQLFHTGTFSGRCENCNDSTQPANLSSTRSDRSKKPCWGGNRDKPECNQSGCCILLWTKSCQRVRLQTLFLIFILIPLQGLCESNTKVLLYIVSHHSKMWSWWHILLRELPQKQFWVFCQVFICCHPQFMPLVAGAHCF